MLILSRKKEESIVLNGNIEIMVVDIDKNGNVKLGVKAPKEVTIYRKEIYEEILNSNKEAAEASNASLDFSNNKFSEIKNMLIENKNKK